MIDRPAAKLSGTPDLVDFGTISDQRAPSSQLAGPGTDADSLPPRIADAASIERYELGAVIGAGGMGQVYRAFDRALGRSVAVKILHPRLLTEAGIVRRFVEKAQITGQLQHPGVPPVYDLGSFPDGRPFLAMKLIGGETLANLLTVDPGNRSRFMPVFAQIAHARGAFREFQRRRHADRHRQ